MQLKLSVDILLATGWSQEFAVHILLPLISKSNSLIDPSKFRPGHDGYNAYERFIPEYHFPYAYEAKWASNKTFINKPSGTASQRQFVICCNSIQANLALVHNRNAMVANYYLFVETALADYMYFVTTIENM